MIKVRGVAERGALRPAKIERIVRMAGSGGYQDTDGYTVRFFRIKWIRSSMHPTPEMYTRTRGFLDTTIYVDRGGISKIEHTRDGSAYWMRNDINEAVATLSDHPENIRRLASAYKDRLWVVDTTDPDYGQYGKIVENQVRTISDERWANMSDDDRKRNQAMIAAKHTHKMESVPQYEAVEQKIENDRLKEERLLLENERIKLEADRIEFDKQAEAKVTAAAKIFKDYWTMGKLMEKSIGDLRQLTNNIGGGWQLSWTKQQHCEFILGDQERRANEAVAKLRDKSAETVAKKAEETAAESVVD